MKRDASSLPTRSIAAGLVIGLLALSYLWTSHPAPEHNAPSKSTNQPTPHPAPSIALTPSPAAILQAQIAALFARPATLQDALDTAELYEKWAEFDPKAALADAMLRIPKNSMEALLPLYGSIFKVWARRDPVQAWDHMVSLSRDDLFKTRYAADLAKGVLAGWLENGQRQNYARAIELINLTANSETSDILSLNRSNLIREILAHAAANDLEFALRVFESEKEISQKNTSDDPIKSYGNAIVEEWAKTAPANAANWALQQDPKTFDSLSHTIVMQWWEADPQAAFDWLETNFEGESLEKHYEQFIYAISQKYPSETSELVKDYFLNNAPSSRSGIRLGLARTLAYREPELALKLLDQIKADPSSQNELKVFQRLHKIQALKSLLMADEVAGRAQLAALDPEDPEDAQIIQAYEKEFNPTSKKDLLNMLFQDWSTVDYASFEKRSPAILDLYEFHLDGERLDEQLKQMALAWGQLAPERVRYYLDHQTVLSPEVTAELLAKLDI